MSHEGLARDPLPGPSREGPKRGERVSGRTPVGCLAPTAPAAFEAGSHLTSLPAYGYEGGGAQGQLPGARDEPEVCKTITGHKICISLTWEHPKSAPATLLQIQEPGITVTAQETPPKGHTGGASGGCLVLALFWSPGSQSPPPASP